MKHFAIFTLLIICLKSYSCNEIGFIKFTTYRGVDQQNIQYEKEFYVPRYYRATSQEALILCNHFGMKLAALETVEEFNHLRTAMKLKSNLFSTWSHIGGLTVKPRSSSNSDWYWVESQQPISYAMSWADGKPNFARNAQWCLGIGPNSDFRYVDIECFGAIHAGETFICEKKISHETKNVY